MAFTRINDAVVITANTYPVDLLLEQEAAVKAIADTLGDTKLIGVADGLFRVDYKRLASAVSALVVSIQDGRDITRADILASADFLVPVLDADLKRAHPKYPSYVASLDHGMLQWPIADALPGIVSVMGDTGSGKTTYLVDTADIDVIVRYGEPFEHVDLATFKGSKGRGPITIGSSSIVEAISVAMLLSALSFRVAIDSLRTLVYGLKGNAMEGGMVATLFDLLTQLNNLVAESGHVIYVAINPMLADESKADRLFKRVAASTTGAVHLAEGTVKAKTYRLGTGRYWNAGPAGTQVDDGFTGPPSSGPSVRKLADAAVRDSVALAYGGFIGGDDHEHPRDVAQFNLK